MRLFVVEFYWKQTGLKQSQEVIANDGNGARDVVLSIWGSDAITFDDPFLNY